LIKCISIDQTFLMNLKLALCLTFLSCFFSLTIFAQMKTSGTITGRIVEASTGMALQSAVVKLFKEKDTVAFATVLTDKSGYFNVIVQRLDKYELKVSFVGYVSVAKLINLSSLSPTVDLGKIALKDGIDLNVVTVTGTIIPLKIKKDTLEYDTRAFKTAPNANVENLMRKIGGIEVDPYGNIKVHGVDLSKIMVGGKKFFGDNYKIATQNLPSEAIAKIQVIESKTEESIRSGIDDGKREKVINLVLKDDKKGGYFGSMSLASGTSERYLASANVNHFNENLQVNLLLMSNNNNQSYSVGEVGGFSGNDFGAGAVSGEVNGIAFGRISQGLTKTNATALNFSRGWGKKVKNSISSYYIGSFVDSKTDLKSDIQNIQTNRTFLNGIHTAKETDNQSHSLSFEFNSTIDSLTSFYFSPTLGLEKSNSIANLLTSTTNADGSPINKAVQNIDNHTYQPSIGGFLSFRHKLRKGKGSYNFSLGHSYSKNDADNFNLNQTQFFSDDVLSSALLINQLQQNNNLNTSFNFRGQLSRVVSRDKNSSLLLNASIINSNRDANQYTFDYNPLNDNYEIVVADLTSVYKNELTHKDLAIGFNRSNAKTTFIATANLQAVNLDGELASNGQLNHLERNYLAVLPRLTFSYRTASRKSISFNVNANLNIPSITDLQPVQNNLNRLYIREGNPLLKPAKNYSAQLSYNTFNVKTNRYANYGINFLLNVDQMSTANVFEEATAITYVKPINVDGGYSVSGNAGYGGPIKGLRGLSINYGASASRQLSVNYINNQKNNTTSLSLGGNASFNYSFKESLVLSLSNYSNYIDTRNSVQQTVNNSYFRLNSTGNLSFEFVKKWRLASSLNHQANLGRNDDFNQQMLLVNVGIQRFLMPQDQFVLELKCYDLFDQNSNISRIFSANRIEDTQSLNLRRYFLMKLTYKVNKIQVK